MTAKKRLVLLGGGGHASDVLGLVESIQPELQVAGILDDGQIDAEAFGRRGVHQIGSIADVLRIDATHYISCGGWPATRRRFADAADSAGMEALTLVHPSAYLGTSVELGAGTVVFPCAAISPLAQIGRHVYVSQVVSVGHHVKVGDHCSLMPSSVISGEVEFGDRSTLGTNAAIVEGRRVAADVTIGAGATVVSDLTEPGVYVGTPAKLKRTTAQDRRD